MAACTEGFSEITRRASAVCSACSRKTSRRPVRPRSSLHNAGNPSWDRPSAATSAPGLASRPTRRPRRRPEARGERRTAGLPCWRKFSRRRNIGSPPVITGVTTSRPPSLIEGLDLLERLLQVLDEDIAVPSEVALVPCADKVREEPVEVVHVRPVEGLFVQRVDRPDSFPSAVLVVVLSLAVLERHPEMDLPVRLDIVHLEGVPDAALVHRSVEQLDRLDCGRVETGSPVPIPIRERVGEHGPVRVRRLEREVYVDLVEPLPDFPEVLDERLVELEARDVLLPDVLDDFFCFFLEFRVQGGEPVIPLGLLRRHGQVPSHRRRMKSLSI